MRALARHWRLGGLTPILVALITAGGGYLAAHRENADTRAELRRHIRTTLQQHSDSLRTIALREDADRRAIRRIRHASGELFIGPPEPPPARGGILAGMASLWTSFFHRNKKEG